MYQLWRKRSSYSPKIRWIKKTDTHLHLCPPPPSEPWLGALSRSQWYSKPLEPYSQTHTLSDYRREQSLRARHGDPGDEIGNHHRQLPVPPRGCEWRLWTRTVTCNCLLLSSLLRRYTCAFNIWLHNAEGEQLDKTCFCVALSKREVSCTTREDRDLKLP